MRVRKKCRTANGRLYGLRTALRLWLARCSIPAEPFRLMPNNSQWSPPGARQSSLGMLPCSLGSSHCPAPLACAVFRHCGALARCPNAFTLRARLRTGLRWRWPGVPFLRTAVPCCPTIRNARLPSLGGARLGFFLAHWVLRIALRLWLAQCSTPAEGFAPSSGFHPSLRSGFDISSRCFRHRRRPSCAPGTPPSLCSGSVYALPCAMLRMRNACPYRMTVTNP